MVYLIIMDYIVRLVKLILVMKIIKTIRLTSRNLFNPNTPQN